MVKYHRNTVGSLLMAPERGGSGRGGWQQRMWPLTSAAELRRRLVAALVCGGRGSSHKGFGCGCSRRFLLSRSPPLPATNIPPDRRRGVQNGRPGSLMELIRMEPPEEEQEHEEEEEEEDHEGDTADRETTETAENRRRDEESVTDMRTVVAMLRSESTRERGDAAKGVRRLAKGDPGARETMTELGAVSPLVAMIDDPDAADHVRVDALYALLNLGIGNDGNKAVIVKAGALHSMLRLVGPCSVDDTIPSSPPLSHATTTPAIVANLLSLSALDANKPIIATSGAIPFLVSAYRTPLTDPTDLQARDDALRALFNLSLFSPNAPRLADADLIPALLAALESSDPDSGTAHAERSLAVLSNILAAAPEARRDLSRRAADAFPLLVDALGWVNAPRCQEAAAYVLMVMAHRSSPRDRTALAEAGAQSALLELTLLGTPLAQKRASKVLQFLTGGKAIPRPVDRSNDHESLADGATGCSMSAPQCGLVEQGADDEMISEERRAVRRLVQQSLETNMRRITNRANVPAQTQYFPPPDRLVSSTSSKSLPF